MWHEPSSSFSVRSSVSKRDSGKSWSSDDESRASRDEPSSPARRVSFDREEKEGLPSVESSSSTQSSTMSHALRSVRDKREDADCPIFT